MNRITSSPKRQSMKYLNGRWKINLKISKKKSILLSRLARASIILMEDDQLHPMSGVLNSTQETSIMLQTKVMRKTVLRKSTSTKALKSLLLLQSAESSIQRNQNWMILVSKFLRERHLRSMIICLSIKILSQLLSTKNNTACLTKSRPKDQRRVTDSLLVWHQSFLTIKSYCLQSQSLLLLIVKLATLTVCITDAKVWHAKKMNSVQASAVDK